MSEYTVAIATFGLAALAFVWKAYVLTILWAWFVVPTFGLPYLTLAPAIGLAAAVGCLIRQHIPKAAKPADQSTGDVTARIFAHLILTPLTALLVGWIAKQWM